MLHNSHFPFFREPAGAVACNTEVIIRFFSREALGVTLRTWDGQERRMAMVSLGKGRYEARLMTPAAPVLLWYDFIIDTAEGQLRYGNAYDNLGGRGAIYEGQPQSYQITVYDPAYTTPEFLRQGVAYQIFPDRFSKKETGEESVKGAAHGEAIYHEKWDEEPLVMPDPRSGDNMALDFFGGNLRGIEEKLPYLQELGVTVLYLNPIFQARSNHRYDTGDYRAIDPILGTEEDFCELCRKARERGIQVLLDGVFSHTGEDSRYFNRYGRYDSVGAFQSKESPYAPWYRFDNFPLEYASWWGIPSLPEVVKMEESYRRFLFHSEEGVLPHWQRQGAAGWRLDVADELPMDFLRELRRAVKAQEDGVVLGEVWEDASNKVSYGEMRSYCLGDTLDSVMNYPLREGIIGFLTGQWTAGQLARLIRHQQEVYPDVFFYSLMNLIGSHDRARIINVMAGCEWANLPREERRGLRLSEDQYKLGAARYIKAMEILCALPGMPTLYYGDEAGMEGTADPFCRGTFPWGHQDEALTEAVRGLIGRRRGSEALRTGDLHVSAPDDDTLRIRRRIQGGRDVFGDPAADETVVTQVHR